MGYQQYLWWIIQRVLKKPFGGWGKATVAKQAKWGSGKSQEKQVRFG